MSRSTWVGHSPLAVHCLSQAIGCRDVRIPVATVIAMLGDGMTAEEVIRDLPDLEPEDIQEALRYAAEVLKERELPLKRPA